MRVHLMDERPQRNGRAYTHKSKGGKLQKVSTVVGTFLNHQPATLLFTQFLSRLCLSSEHHGDNHCRNLQQQRHANCE